MRVITISFIVGFVGAQVWGWHYARAIYAALDQGYLSGPPTLWFISLSVVEVAAAAWAFAKFAKPVPSQISRVGSGIGAFLLGAIACSVTVSPIRPLAPIIEGRMQLVVDLASAAIVGAVLGYLFSAFIAARAKNDV